MTREEFLAKYLVIQAEVGSIAKTGYNDFHHYKTTETETVIRPCREACNKNGLALITTVDLLPQQDEGIYLMKATVELSDLDGNRISSNGYGAGADKGDKGLPKAETIAYRYALRHLFAIDFPKELDPEKDESVDESAEMKDQLLKSTKLAATEAELKGVNVSFQRNKDSLIAAHQKAVAKAIMEKKKELVP